MPLTITIQKSSSLRENEIAAMHQLHARYFANARTTTFRADLTRKDWVIRLFDNGRLVGFSTQKLLADEIAGRTVRFLFSGDHKCPVKSEPTTRSAL